MKSDEYQRLKDIEDFIEPFHDLWQYEILNEHPRLYNPHWEAQPVSSQGLIPQNSLSIFKITNRLNFQVSLITT